MLFTHQEPARNVESQQQEHLQKNLTKLIIIFISITVVIALVVSVLAITLSNNKSVYSAYLQLINQYETNYGICTVEQDKLLGFCFAQMVDFDNNQTEELLLCYREPEDQEYQYDIYSFNGRKPKKVYSDVSNSASPQLRSENDSLQTVTRDQQTYIVKITVFNDEHGDWERREYIGFEDGKFVVQMTLDRHLQEDLYRVDGKNVSKAEYIEQLKKWETNTTIVLSQDNIDQLKKEIEDTKEDLEELIIKYDSKETLTNAKATEQVLDEQPTAADRFGKVVSDGENIYYWKANDNAINKDGSFSTEYPYSLIQNTNGVETVVTQGRDNGNLALANNRIFFESGGGSIRSCKLDGSDIRSYGEGSYGLVGVTDDNQGVIIQTEFPLIYLSAIDFSETVLSESASFLLCHNNKIYYSPHGDSMDNFFGSRKICVINPDGTENKTLYTAPAEFFEEGEFNQNYTKEHHFLNPYIQDDFLYVFYGLSADWSLPYARGRIIKININNGDSEIVAGQTELVGDGYIVDKSGNVTITGSTLLDNPPTLYMNGYENLSDGSVVVYNVEKQQKETIITPADYSSLTTSSNSENSTIRFNFVEQIGKKVYFSATKETYVFDSGYNYLTALFEKDLTTGKVTELNRF